MDSNSIFSANSRSDSRTSLLLKNVYLWMTLALGITGVTAMGAANSVELQQAMLNNRILFWGMIIAEFAVVWYITASINKISFIKATTLFIIYSVLNGLTLSIIFSIYTQSSIASAFFVTAGTFAVMSLYGYATKRDLSSWGNILFMGVIGLIIASVVNMFWANSTLYWITTYAGVLIFVGLTAYDTQKIKRMLTGVEINENSQKLALLGSLILYIDFINLFLYLLRILGSRR